MPWCVDRSQVCLMKNMVWSRFVDIKQSTSSRVHHLRRCVEQYKPFQDALCNRVVMMRCESIVDIRVI
jgi:hypothetical protein